MIGLRHPRQKRSTPKEFLAPLDPEYFGEVRLAVSLQKASELVDYEVPDDARARSMASHPSTSSGYGRSDEVA
jgi:hypothetical protein